MEKKYDNASLLELAKKVVEEAEANAQDNPTTNKIQVVIVEPNKKPYKKIITNDLKSFQDIVGGYIENVFIGRTKKGARVGITLNEEGKLDGLPMNRMIANFDVLVGTFFITAYNLQGDNVSLNDEECNHYIRRFNTLEVYL